MHENEPSPSNQPEHVTSEQIPHSGIHHDEHPVDEFDNTPLPEAVERGLVNPTPDTPAGLEPTESTEKKSHKKLVIGGVAFLAGAAVIAGSVIGIRAAGDAPKNTPPKPDPKATSQTPEATPAPTAKAEVLTVESLEIPAGATPEQIGTTFLQDRISAWEMAGATPDVFRAWATAGGSTGDFVAAIADKNGDIFADALLVPNWRDVPALVQWVDNEKKANASDLENWLLTYKSQNSEDQEAFTSSVTVDSTQVVSQNETGTTLKTTATEHNNADKNRIGSKYDPTMLTINGSQFAFMYTLQTINGVLKISALSAVQL